MIKISQIEALEKLMADLNSRFLEQQEILNKLDCKIAISTSTLAAIETKIIRLKTTLNACQEPKK